MLNEFSKKEAPIQGLAGMGGGVPSRLLTLASGTTTYVDDVFSTFLYDGTEATQTITNGIDLSGEGGLVWAKSRSSRNHILSDTERGTGKVLFSNSSSADDADSTTITSYNSNGFTMGTSTLKMNTSGEDFCSWTFRKCPGFFDVVTYTGNGTSGRIVSHSLGSVPGCIMIKRTDSSSNWITYHRGLDSSAPEDYRILLNDSAGRVSDEYNIAWASTAPTATEFTLGTYSQVNADGGTYVAYIFAHNDGSFGEDSDEAVIKCGSYTGNGTSSNEINVGFEPQWLLVKDSSSTNNWGIYDIMRGITTGGNDPYLMPDLNNAEDSAYNFYSLTPTGFEVVSSNGFVNNNNNTYIYIAIRRPHKPPEAATEVFTPVLASSSGDYTATAGFPIDLNFYGKRSGSDKWFWRTRLTGNGYLQSHNSNAISGSGNTYWDSMTAFKVPGASGDYSDYINYNFKRAPGFFDVVTFTGNGSTQDITHNLGVAPELLIIKSLSSDVNSGWTTYSATTGNNNVLRINDNTAASGTTGFRNTTPTATQFFLEHYNASGVSFVAFLFASLDGISKVGSYTGSGADGNNIDCGFTNGARFVMVKKTDSSGDWFVADTVRGINAGSDPFLKLNTTDAENNTVDWIDAYSAGFTINGAGSDFNDSGGTYLFLAIA